MNNKKALKKTHINKKRNIKERVKRFTTIVMHIFIIIFKVLCIWIKLINNFPWALFNSLSSILFESRFVTTLTGLNKIGSSTRTFKSTLRQLVTITPSSRAYTIFSGYFLIIFSKKKVTIKWHMSKFGSIGIDYSIISKSWPLIWSLNITISYSQIFGALLYLVIIRRKTAMRIKSA
jgi:hypothetical protein